MSTRAQVNANRANARKSTGPTSAAGKARSSQNAVKHGLNSKEFVVREDEREEFANLSHSLRERVEPEGALEEVVFSQLLHAAWNLRRVRRLEAELFQNEADPLANQALDQQLDRLARYQARFERSLYRALTELRTLQTNRCVRPTLPDIVEDNIPELASVQRIHRAKQTQRHSFPSLFGGGMDGTRYPDLTPAEAAHYAAGFGAAGNLQLGSFSVGQPVAEAA
jgi:hypothetical protein